MKKVWQTKQYFGNKPKNFSRKGLLCSCDVVIIFDKKVIDKVNVKYYILYKGYIEIDNSKDIILSNLKGLNLHTDFTYTRSYFKRDDRSMPFIEQIQILNILKYNSALRKLKLEKLRITE